MTPLELLMLHLVASYIAGTLMGEETHIGRAFVGQLWIFYLMMYVFRLVARRN